MAQPTRAVQTWELLAYQHPMPRAPCITVPVDNNRNDRETRPTTCRGHGTGGFKDGGWLFLGGFLPISN